MNFINLYALGSLAIPNINGGKRLRWYKNQTNPEQGEKLSHLVLCQSSMDSKVGNPSGRPENLLYNKMVLTKHNSCI